MLASKNAALDGGNAWAARPSVPAAPATAALSEPPQPTSAIATRASTAVAGSRCRRTGSRRVVMPALYRRRIERPCREACGMPNIFEPEFDQQREHPGFRAQRARLGWQLATQRLGASIWEIEPGEAAYPYHYHLGEEELLIVLMGRPSVRTDGDWRELEPGEVLSFRARPGGRPPARELGRGDRALPRDLDERHAGSRRLPRLRQARRLRAAARTATASGRSSAWPTPSTTTTASGRPRAAALVTFLRCRLDTSPPRGT